MPNPRTEGDLVFENYCAANGYVAERDIDWRARFGVQTDKDPDYLIERGGDRTIAEVKQFESTKMTDRLMASPGRAIWWSGRDLYANVERAVRAGAEQLMPFAAVGVALILVLTNPLQRDVSFDTEDVISALLGQVRYHFDLESGRQTASYDETGVVMATSADGEPENRLPHLSAVITLYGFDDFPRLDVYDLSTAPGFAGTPVPRTMFDGENDVRFGFVAPRTFRRLTMP